MNRRIRLLALLSLGVVMAGNAPHKFTQARTILGSPRVVAVHRAGFGISPALRGLTLEAGAPSAVVPSAAVSVDGLGNGDNFDSFGFRVAPPDANGDAGPNHYVQQVQLLVRVFDKTGTPLTPPFRLSSLWSGVGGECANEDRGSPVVAYDPLADRWLLSQFAFATITAPPFYHCVAVSQTSDPTGSYFLYAFEIGGRNFPASPKLGVWPDAYYMATDQFLDGASFNGSGAFAFERDKMLAGDPGAALIYFDLDLATFPDGLAGMLPSDLDGLTPPPAGAANIFAALAASEFGDPVDGVRLFEFHANFAQPSASTFVERVDSPLAVVPFNPLSPPGRDDIEQPPPATTSASLDSVPDRLMHRLAYRNFGGYESLAVSHTVNVGAGTTLATHQAGIRYYELRKSGSGLFAVHEQATFAPDAANRWLPSAAMDNDGNLAVGYSVSSSTIFPSIRYAGRLATDPPGGLHQGETALVAGSGVQTSTGSRWGDYSALTVDPADDCTFWYTNEYYTAASQSTSSVGWLTRISTFKFPSCTPAEQGVVQGIVTNAATGVPIPGARIGTTGGYRRITDGAGAYGMTMAAGSHDVTAAAFGYLPASAGVLVNDGETATQHFALQPIPVLVAAGATLTKESCSINGAPDPFETVTVSLGIRNIGAVHATGVIATLESSEAVAIAGGATRGYGVLQAGGPPVARSFTFTAHAACGSTLTVTLRLREGGLDLGAATFSFAVGAIESTPQAAVHSSGHLATPILDFTTVDIPIGVPDLGLVEDVNVRIRLSHTFDADLTLSLIAPDGTVVVLASGHGGGGDHFGAGATDCSGTPTVFDDEAAAAIEDGAAPFAGAFRPATPLSALDGKRTDGTWRLRVHDGFALDQGMVHCVQLEINRFPLICCSSGS